MVMLLIAIPIELLTFESLNPKASIIFKYFKSKQEKTKYTVLSP